VQSEKESLGGRAIARDVQRFGVLCIDRQCFAVELQNQRLPLTRVEFDLLEKLARNVGTVVTYRGLVEEVLQSRFVPESNALRVHLAHLRRKLGSAAGAIVTVRGRGLLFDPERLQR
jgi:DNA-binding response OmpR family regulator